VNVSRSLGLSVFESFSFRITGTGRLSNIISRIILGTELYLYHARTSMQRALLIVGSHKTAIGTHVKHVTRVLTTQSVVHRPIIT